jgi:hypothetical protein
VEILGHRKAVLAGCRQGSDKREYENEFFQISRMM